MQAILKTAPAPMAQMDVVSYVHSGSMQDVYDLIDQLGIDGAATELCARAAVDEIDLCDGDDMVDYLLRISTAREEV